MRMRSSLCSLFLATVLALVQPAFAEISDPWDPLDTGNEDVFIKADEEKTSQELINEALTLLFDERLLDARSKLLLALKKDPTEYRAHMMLANYYLVHVGHFRLALQYINQAQKIFKEKHGEPPYVATRQLIEHSQILYTLSQARLNLDNYQGALDVLDQFEKLGYHEDWYSGSRAWILMKLNRLEEAIRVARAGYATLSSEAEKGQVLNMLGILYSMSHQRLTSLEVFREAVAQELSLGVKGQPATPLNNAGEVYKEIFDEDKAESAWLRATSLKDGCDHVLPSLNLTLLYLDQLNLSGAKKTMDNFESCVAQFPLRNGEEHRALVHFARGRISLLSGKVDDAIAHFEASLQKKQWFGKIGTSENDLAAAGHLLLAQALSAKAEQIRTSYKGSLVERGEQLLARVESSFKSWWNFRKSSQILAEDLDDFEDLYVRNTDSLLPYPFVGDLTQVVPARIFKRKIAHFSNEEDRTVAKVYYTQYLAETELNAGRITPANDLFQQVLSSVRPKFDDALKLRALLMSLTFVKGDIYRERALAAFALNRAALWNAGLKLPVRIETQDDTIRNALLERSFVSDTDDKPLYIIRGSSQDGGYVLQLIAYTGVLGNLKVSSANLSEAVAKLTEEVFSFEVK